MTFCWIYRLSREKYYKANFENIILMGDKKEINIDRILYKKNRWKKMNSKYIRKQGGYKVRSVNRNYEEKN
jgi:hypothetical protein